MEDKIGSKTNPPIVINSCALKLIILGIPLFFLSLALAVGIWFLGSVVPDGARRLINAGASNTWPTAEGKVISSKVRSAKVPVPRRGGGPGEQTRYFADILYQYTVQGKAVSSSMVSFGDHGSSDPADAESVVKKYPAGSRVTVYYSPDGPETSVLERGLTFSTRLYAVPFFLVAMLIIRAASRSIARRRIEGSK